jgi:hypothetical protein
MLYVVVGIGLLLLAQPISSTGLLIQAAGLYAGAVAVAGVGIIVLALAKQDWSKRADTLVLVVTGIACLVTNYLFTIGVAGFRSDEVAVIGGAADAVLHGQNPYTVNYESLSYIAGHVSRWFTPTFTGSHLLQYVYPPGLALLLAPFDALFGVEGVRPVFALMFLAGCLLAWKLVRPSVRPLILLLMIFVSMTGWPLASGDAVVMPFLVVAFWRWDAFFDSSLPWYRRYLGPLAFGFACSLKQNAFLIAPFIAVALVMESRHRQGIWVRSLASYGGVGLACFTAISLPYFIANPHAFASALIDPFVAHTIVFGNGVVSLVESGYAGGGNLDLMNWGADLMMLALLLATVAFYGRLRRVVPMLPLLALILSTRSLQTYYLVPLAAAVVYADGLSDIELRPALRGHRLLGGASAMAACLSAVAIFGSLAGQPPLAVRAGSEMMTKNSLESISVVVVNRGGEALTPHFFAMTDPSSEYTLAISSGPKELAPHATSIYTLTPLAVDGIGAGWQFRVMAVTTAPDSLSLSPVITLPSGYGSPCGICQPP